MIFKKTLANNITFVSHTLENAASCAIGFFFSVGSRYEKENERGISHFTEHLLFKGTVTRSTQDIARTFDRLGGQVNAFTEKDTVCAYCLVPALENAPLTALDVLCDMAENCTFPNEELEREREVVKSEILSVEDDADECASEAVARAVWKNQSLSYSITGSAGDVSNLTVEQVRAWYNAHFAHGELLVVCAGAFDSSAFEKRLVCMKEHKRAHCYPSEFHDSTKNLWSRGVYFVRSRFSQCQLFTLYPFSMPLALSQYSALLVFNALMGESMSSRLFESLREKNGLCYSVYSFFTCYEDTGFWAVSVSCAKKNVFSVVSTLRKELSGVKVDLTEAEVEGAKAHLLGEEYLGGSDTEFLLRRHQRHIAMGFPLMETEEVLSCIRKVSKSDIISLIEILLSEENRSFVSYSPRLQGKAKGVCL